ncbi:fungal-specific transcription factor domain-containing protein [Myxozyma melibiosi]|uniref:Fungal-specific transcription factor domain-containing protein n=1 Tax=Myxozyma melibiosi TaxID=54550 RepID=A0ABR1F4Y6_9ASCO
MATNSQAQALRSILSTPPPPPAPPSSAAVSVSASPQEHYRSGATPHSAFKRSQSPDSPSVASSYSPATVPPPKGVKRSRKASERQRVSRACDNCKQKKTRCSGNMPCFRCVGLAIPCEFTAEYHRGRPPAPEASGLDIPAAAYKNAAVAKAARSADRPRTPKEAAEQMTTATLTSTRNSPEPPQTDVLGQYVGSSSGIAFLNRVQRRLHDMDCPNTSSSILTFGDPELPDYNSGCFILPPKTEAKKMIDFYFSYAMPTYRFLHQPTVNEWFEEFYESFDSLEMKEGMRERNAIVIMLMAQARKYPSATTRNNSSGSSNYVDNSSLYFHAAERQLKMETGRPRLSSVQARLCQCFYLLSCSRINHCRSLFGTTAHLIQALGLHRRQKQLASPVNVDYIEQESRKRVFWSAYSLDKYLSAVLGRPSIFHDNDIDQELPSLVNDADLSAKEIRLENYRTVNCIMLAPVLHAKLVRLLSGILRDIYSIHRISHARKIGLCKQYTSDLKAWYATLPAFLDPKRVQPSLLMTLLQRQSRMLSLAYAHSLILVNRPFLLTSFASLTPGKYGYAEREADDGDHEAGIQECLSAAMIAVAIIDDLSESQEVFSALWFTQYVAFCSVVVLYVYTIRSRAEGGESWQEYLEAAQKCQRQISSAAKENSLAQRYSIILEELRVEAVREREASGSAPAGAEPPPPQQQQIQSQQGQAVQQHEIIEQQQEHGRGVGMNENEAFGGIGVGRPQMEVQSHSTELLGLQPNPRNPQVSGSASTQVMSHEEMLKVEDSEMGMYPSQLIEDLTSWENFDTLVMDFLGTNMPFEQQQQQSFV